MKLNDVNPLMIKHSFTSSISFPENTTSTQMEMQESLMTYDLVMSSDLIYRKCVLKVMNRLKACTVSMA